MCEYMWVCVRYCEDTCGSVCVCVCVCVHFNPCLLLSDLSHMGTDPGDQPGK